MEILSYNVKWTKPPRPFLVYSYHRCARRQTKETLQELKKTEHNYSNVALALGHKNILGLILSFPHVPNFL